MRLSPSFCPIPVLSISSFSRSCFPGSRFSRSRSSRSRSSDRSRFPISRFLISRFLEGGSTPAARTALTLAVLVVVMTGPGSPAQAATDLEELTVTASRGEIRLRSAGAAVTGAVPTKLRATYLSLQSFVGRLSFSGTLFLLTLAVPAAAATAWPTIRTQLGIAALGSVGFLVFIGVVAIVRGRRDDNLGDRQPPKPRAAVT